MQDKSSKNKGPKQISPWPFVGRNTVMCSSVNYQLTLLIIAKEDSRQPGDQFGEDR